MTLSNNVALGGRPNAMSPWFAAFLYAALFIVAHGASAASPSCEARALSRHEALKAQDLGNWESVDDHTLLIWAKGAIRAHLVRLATPLAGLSEAPIIMLLDGDGDQVISPCGRDAVTVPGARVETARIKSMELLSAKRTAEIDRPDATIAEALHRA